MAASALLLAMLAGCGSRESSAEESKPTPTVEVTLARATSVDVPLTLDAPATIFPREQANISARITAPIRRLLAALS